jgi:D-sedoheptulose 7-phosphate isomerase
VLKLADVGFLSDQLTFPQDRWRYALAERGPMPYSAVSLDRYVERFQSALGLIPVRAVERLSQALCNAYDARRTIFLCGNGGSGSNASHICEDLAKSTLDADEFDDDQIQRLRILSLTDNTPYILAIANDVGYERVFVEQLKTLAQPGDVLIALSGSGNSPNVLRAVDWSNRHELETWGVCGFDGGQLRTIAQQSVHFPVQDMGMVETLHLLVFHWVLQDLYGHLHPQALRAGTAVATDSSRTRAAAAEPRRAAAGVPR